jgi:DNA repair protein RadA/Sms
MPKSQIIFTCANCGAQLPKWSGRCLECGQWGTLKEEILEESHKKNNAGILVKPAEIIDLTTIKDDRLSRLQTGISELDRVFGGGIAPGSLILLSGEPGIGKSTILAQIADAVGSAEKPSFYISGEESSAQVKNRLQRLNCDLNKIKFASETNVEKNIAAAAEINPAIIIVDSIQTVASSAQDSEPGSLNQIRASASLFLEFAKEKNIPVILIGHITKDGIIAGPKALEHIVDTVLYLESETVHNYRILRATKNRFGSVNEIGVFEMTEKGFKEVANPSSIFLESSHENLPGSVVSCIIEGTRPFLVEIQALVTKTVFGYPQRKASGFDLNRLQVLAAVLTKRAKLNLINQDIIINAVGGIKINDPALDLAVCASIISSILNQPIDGKTVILGEVGLGGEIRNISKLEQRLKEAEKLGFIKAIVPNIEIKTSKIKLKKVKNISELVDLIK